VFLFVAWQASKLFSSSVLCVRINYLDGIAFSCSTVSSALKEARVSYAFFIPLVLWCAIAKEREEGSQMEKEEKHLTVNKR
jgi:hypothetical protein